MPCDVMVKYVAMIVSVNSRLSTIIIFSLNLRTCSNSFYFYLALRLIFLGLDSILELKT